MSRVQVPVVWLADLYQEFMFQVFNSSCISSIRWLSFCCATEPSLNPPQSPVWHRSTLRRSWDTLQSWRTSWRTALWQRLRLSAERRLCILLLVRTRLKLCAYSCATMHRYTHVYCCYYYRRHDVGSSEQFEIMFTKLFYKTERLVCLYILSSFVFYILRALLTFMIPN